MKTYSAKPESVERDWYVIDAEGQNLGPYGRQVIADRLRGKQTSPNLLLTLILAITSLLLTLKKYM